MAFGDLWQSVDHFLKHYQCLQRFVSQLHFKKDFEVAPRAPRINECHVAAYPSVLFESPKSTLHRSSRQADPSAKFRKTQVPILLQLPEDGQVNLVHAAIFHTRAVKRNDRARAAAVFRKLTKYLRPLPPIMD